MNELLRVWRLEGVMIESDAGGYSTGTGCERSKSRVACAAPSGSDRRAAAHPTLPPAALRRRWAGLLEAGRRRGRYRDAGGLRSARLPRRVWLARRVCRPSTAHGHGVPIPGVDGRRRLRMLREPAAHDSCEGRPVAPSERRGLTTGLRCSHRHLMLAIRGGCVGAVRKACCGCAPGWRRLCSRRGLEPGSGGRPETDKRACDLSALSCCGCAALRSMSDARCELHSAAAPCRRRCRCALAASSLRLRWRRGAPPKRIEPWAQRRGSANRCTTLRRSRTFGWRAEVDQMRGGWSQAERRSICSKMERVCR